MKNKLHKIEMMRGLAAIYVMVSHFLSRFTGESGLLGLPLRFGQEAVMLFFLISGFVVFYSTEKQRPDFATYISRRWMRIYPIFLLALLLCAFDITILRSQSMPWRELVGNLLMLQDFSYGKPGVWFAAFGGNSPLWSLAYEWWFYMLFYPIWRFVAADHQRTAASIISLIGLVGYICYPNQPCLYLAYFILWWTGAEFARQYLAEGRVTFRTQQSSIFTLTCFVGLVTVLLLSRRGWTGSLHFGLYPILQIRHFIACIVIALSALWWQRLNWRGFDAIFGVFQRVAPVSYGIYVLHYPIGISGSFLQFLTDDRLRLLVAICGTMVAAWLAEVPFQNLLKYITRDFLPKRTLPLPAVSV